MTSGTQDFTSVRYHLAYPRQATVFTWVECSCLARSLGYRDASIEVCYRQAVDARHQADGFQLAQLDAFLSSKFFKSGFDFSYNSHSCEWNEQVVRRAFAVMAGRGMTFEQLHTTRVAYGLYESSDLRGLKAKPRTVMRALKACGRAISLGKMAHRVRHMRFHEPGRLQLDEFIDLALWAGPLADEEEKSALPQSTSLQPDRGTRLHELVSFDDLLTPLDGRIQRRLDAEYVREERQYVREKVRPTDLALRQCSVLGYRQARLARSREARTAYEPLRRALRAGGAATASFADSGNRPTTSAGGWSSDWWPGEDDNDVKDSTATPEEVERKKRPLSACQLVAQSDLERTQLLLDALVFQTDALPEFHARWTAENLQTLRPGFHRRRAARAAVNTGDAEAARKLAEAEAAAAAEAASKAAARQELTDRRLRRERRFAELAERPTSCPLPSHGRVCDASPRFEAVAPATASQGQKQRRQQQRMRTPTTTRSAVAKPAEAAPSEDVAWLEPHLGLTLPLSSPGGASRPRASRLGFARSCPPRAHPVTVDPGVADSAESEAGQRETEELIQRMVYTETARMTE